MKRLSKEEQNQRRRRSKWLNPLVDMPYCDLIAYFHRLKPRQAEAIFDAMQTATKTNCHWAVYDLSRRFEDQIEMALSVYECRGVFDIGVILCF